ncbi:MAG: DotI/IcmL family type IV secretion protein [Legionella sp.]|nr:DotI/IcmL family type IV secretion protein [Legionella sp.]
MKKTMLWSALFTLICTQIHADVPPSSTQTPPPANSTTPSTLPAMPASQQQQQTQPITTDTQTNQPVTQPNQSTNPMATGAQPIQVNSEQSAPQVINCDYKISADIKTIDNSLILSWSEKAATQAFDFEPNSLDGQMQKLQSCFTEQGWTSFSTALEKSGNLDAIKSQKLTVSSILDGTAQITEATNNQWKVTLPLQVVYQNDKEKVTQLLNVYLTIGRKMTGDLGITQMIASPRTATPTNTNVNPSTSTTPTNSPPAQVNTPPTVYTNPGEQQNPTTNTAPNP